MNCYGRRPPPAPGVRCAPPKPGAVCVVVDLLAADKVSLVIASSPSCKFPSTTSVETPSVKPILMRRACGWPSAPSTQTTRVCPGSTGAEAGAKLLWLFCAPFGPFPGDGCPAAVPPASAAPCRPRREPCPLLPELAPASCGLNLSAAFGTFSTLFRSSIVNIRFVVMPGFSFSSGLLTSMTTL